jgi:2-haloacid dehalogenase
VDKYFTGYFVSGEIGAEKPTKAFFEGAFKRLDGVKPNEVLMIGDSLRADIVGGEAFGLSTCWFDYYNDGGDFPSARPDYTIKSLVELLDLLLPDGKFFVDDNRVCDCSATLINKNIKAYEELA